MDQERFDACMQKICSGDREGLKEIYKEYMPYVFSVIYRVVESHADAEDITADFFIKLWTNSDKYIKGSAHKAYLATIARNMAVDFLRKHKKEVLVSDFSGEFNDEPENGEKDSVTVSDISPQTVGGGLNTDSSVEKEVIENISLKEALATLKPREREVINLKIMSDMTFKEIASVTGAPIGTVTWLYNQALKKLRRCGYE